MRLRRALIFAICFVPVLFPCFREAQAQTVRDIVVEVGDPPPGTDWVQLARDLIYQKPGATFSEELVSQSIENLRRVEWFRSIDVTSDTILTEQGTEEMVLTFLLEPYPIVREIRIRNPYPFFSGEILNQMTVSEGGVFNPADLDEQRELIQDFLSRQGYVDPVVTVNASETPEGYLDIGVEMDLGVFYHLDTLIINGNERFSDFSIKLKMSAWWSSLVPGSDGRFIEAELRNDVRELTRIYRSRHYPEALVRADVERDPENAAVTVRLNVREGREYTFLFTENENIRDGALERTLNLGDFGGVSRSRLQRAAQDMEARYHEEGYPDASVSFEREFSEDTVIVAFTVREGNRIRVKEIDITGNQTVSDSRVRRTMKTRDRGLFRSGAFMPGELENDVERVAALYNSRGFLDAEVNAEVKQVREGFIEVIVRVEENRRTRVADVRIQGLDEQLGNEAREVLALLPGDPFDRAQAEEDAAEIAIFLSEKGYPYVDVQEDVRIDDQADQAVVVYRVDPGTRVYRGSTYYRGNFKTRERILNRSLQMDPGEPFSLREMLTSQQRMRDIEIIESARFTTVGLEDRRDRVHLLVSLVEGEPYFVELGTGLDSVSGVRVNGAVGNRNLFGFNHVLQVGGTLGQTGYRAEIDYILHRPFGWNVDTVYQLYLERSEEFNQEFGTDTFGFTLGIDPIRRRVINPTLFLGFERREQFLAVPGAPADNQFLEPRSILTVSPSVVLDTRDSELYPRRGVLSSLSVDVSAGIQNSLDNFVRYRFASRVFASPFDWLTLVLAAKVGIIDTYGENPVVPEDQLLYLGGSSDVRGYGENLLFTDEEGDALGGLAIAAGSLEAQVGLGSSFELVLFTDTGTLGTTVSGLGDEFRSSWGGGLRYLSPVGPIGLLYGVKFDPRPGESPGQIHFSFGTSF
jgi:outer membrane protein insertion porin family